MDTGTLSVKKIFGQDRRHVVPLFQRPYVWQREAQWEPFWEDIRSIADRLARGVPTRPHFLGAIVLDQVAKPTGHVETRLVIDGQQRLTTLQIFLEAFCDFCEEHRAEKHFKALLKITRNDDPMSEDPDEKFKVWPTTVDQEHFRRVMGCGSPAELCAVYDEKAAAEAVGHPIADAYLYFHRAVTEWLSSGTAAFEARLDALLETVRESLRMVVIDLEKEDDAQLIFETLNARGTPLLPSDLVKNYLFHRAQLAGEDVGKLYGDYWKRFDEEADYWRRESGRGHARRARIDTFLQHYLTLKIKDEVSVAHLYVTFREHMATMRSATEGLAEIRRYAEVYRSFDDLAPATREAMFLSRLSALDLTTAFPVLVELFASHKKNPEVLRGILIDLESFLVRRMVCQLNTRGYNRLFIDLLVAMADSEGTAGDRVRKVLLSSDADSMRWPKDAELRQAWLNNPLYRTLAKKRVRMVLEAIELALRTGKTERVVIDERLTVEHLLPQDWSKHWPLPESGDMEDARETRERVLHTIGNLTLLTKKLNPAISNGRWARKLPEISEHSILRLNNALAKYDAWDEQSIRERGEAMLEVACRIWPRPEGGGRD